MALRELAYSLAPFSLVQEDLPVRSDARKVVPTRRVPDVLHELGVCLDRLLGERKKKVNGIARLCFSYHGTWEVEMAGRVPCLIVPIGSPWDFFVLRSLVRRRTKVTAFTLVKDD